MQPKVVTTILILAMQMVCMTLPYNNVMEWLNVTRKLGKTEFAWNAYGD